MASDTLLLHTTSIPAEAAARPLDWLILFSLCAVLMFGPLAFGAVQPWSLFVMQIGAVALASTWALCQGFTERAKLRINPLFPPCALFGATVLFQLLLGTSAYRHATLAESLRYVAYGLVAFVAAQVLRKQQLRKWFAFVMVAFGFCVAVFGILQQVTFNGKLYWLVPVRESGAVYGPYVNHNHYSGLMELLFPLALALGLESRRNAGIRGLAVFAGVVMASTIPLSLSRGGTIALVVQLVVLAAVFSAEYRSRKAMGWSAAVVVLMLGFVAWVGLEATSKRMATLGKISGEPSVVTRIAITKDTLNMAMKRPALGWGLGTFPTVYPAFRTYYSDKFTNEAHNDYAQFLAETGLVGLAAVLWFAGILVRRGLRAIRSRDSGKMVSVGAFVGCVGLMVHSVFDFNLQIPANAMMFYVMAVLVCQRDTATSATREITIMPKAEGRVPRSASRLPMFRLK